MKKEAPETNMLIRLNALIDVARIADPVSLNQYLAKFTDDFFITLGMRDSVPAYVPAKDREEYMNHIKRQMAFEMGKYLLEKGFFDFSEVPIRDEKNEYVATEVSLQFRFLASKKPIVPRGTK